MQVDINQVLGWAIAVLVAAVVRYFRRSQFWRRVEDRARSYLNDPMVPADDANTAAEKALVDEQRASVRRVADRLGVNTNRKANEKP